MNQQLSDVASIAEIVGAIAVVVLLIFVGLQVRQSFEKAALNTNATQAGAFQALVRNVITLKVRRDRNFAVYL